jgi:hypothetical protein
LPCCYRGQVTRSILISNRWVDAVGRREALKVRNWKRNAWTEKFGGPGYRTAEVKVGMRVGAGDQMDRGEL